MGCCCWNQFWNKVRIIALSLRANIEIVRAAKRELILEIDDGVWVPFAELAPFDHDNAWFAK